MKQKQIEEGRISDHGEGLGTVTSEMIWNRAKEIAAINGRTGHHVLDSDREQAGRELRGEEHLDPAPTAAEKLTEDKRWNPVPGSPGHKTRVLSAPDEQTIPETLIEEGMAEAEHDRQLAAVRERRNE